MLRKRGLKRKLNRFLDNCEEDADPFDLNLGEFQNAARKRESMRIKNQLGPGASKVQSWESTLLSQIHVEEQMLRGTANFIAASRNEQQVLEAAKRLQLGRLRLEMLRFELARLRRGRTSPQAPSREEAVVARPSFAGVSLSDIRIPLRWKRKDHLNDAGDKRKFAVFCIARIGSQIYDTRLLNGVDRTDTDITIDDVILFSRVSPHFELTIELYSRLTNESSIHSSSLSTSDLATASQLLLSTPQLICRTITRAVGRRLAETSFLQDKENNLKDKRTPGKKRTCRRPDVDHNIIKDPYYTNVGPKFRMIASATLTLEHCSDGITSHTFYVEEEEQPEVVAGTSSSSAAVVLPDEGHPRSGQLPLFGEFCCRLAALPYCCETPVYDGKLTVRSGRETAPLEDFWGHLMDWKLSLWSDRDQFLENASALIQIPITRDTCILESDDQNESGTLMISIISHVRIEEASTTCRVSSYPDMKKIEWHLVFKSGQKAEHAAWLVHLLQHAADHQRWKLAALNKMHLDSPSGPKPSSGGAQRTSSALSLLRPEEALGKSVRFVDKPSKKVKKDLKKSFRRTRSQLVMLYNQAGSP